MVATRWPFALLALLAQSAVAATIAISLASHADAVEIEGSAELNANPTTAWRALTDYERYVDFLPDLQSRQERFRSPAASLLEISGGSDAGGFAAHATLPRPGDKHITVRSAQFGHIESAGHEQRTH